MSSGRRKRPVGQRIAEGAVAPAVGARGPKRKPLSELPESDYKRRRIAQEAAEIGSAPLREWPASPPRPALPATDAEWAVLLRLLPGYDPFATADGSRFVPARAFRVLDYIEGHDGSEGRKAQEGLRFVEGAAAGQLVRLEPWERALLANLFGWERADGTRRYRRGLLYIASGNGKSLIASVVACYMFDEEHEGGSQVLTAGTKRDQAKIIWAQAAEMLKNRSDGYGRFQFLQGEVRWASDPRARMMPVSADASTEDGLSPNFVGFDELHRQDNTDLGDTLSKAQKKRREPVYLNLTTADTDRPSPCNEELKFALEVRSGLRRMPSYLPAIYMAEKGCDARDESQWRAANPNLGVSKSADGMREELEEAMAKGGASLLAWKRYHLNIVTKSATGYMQLGAWAACGEPFDPAILAGCECTVGVDLSATTDITAVVAHFKRPALHYVLPWFWVPRHAAVERDKRNDPLYLEWARAGFLTLTEGDQLDDERVLREMRDALAPFRVKEVAIDPWNSLRYTQPLMAKGYNVVQVRQGGITQNEPLKFLAGLVSRKEIRHGGHPVMNWMESNSEIEQDRKGNWALVKPRGSAKIDGMAALVTALARVIAQPQRGVSVYETRGVTVVP